MNGITATSKVVDGIYLDQVNGIPGTEWPTGTPEQPVDNITDALAIMAAREIVKLILKGPGAIVFAAGVDIDIDGDGEFDITIGAGIIVNIKKNLVCGTLTLGAGATLNVYGNLDSLNDAIIIGDDGTLACNGNLICGSLALGQRVTFNVYGNLDVSNGDITLDIDSDLVCNGNLTQPLSVPLTTLSIAAGASVSIHGNAMIADINYSSGDFLCEGNLFIFNGILGTSGTFTVYGDVYVTNDIVNDTGQILIYGNCTCNAITNGTGPITIRGLLFNAGAIVTAGVISHKGNYLEVAINTEAVLANETPVLWLTDAHYLAHVVGVIAGGPFNTGEVVNGVPSGATGVVVGQAAGYIDIIVTSGTFGLADTLTGVGSGATIDTLTEISAIRAPDISHYIVDKFIIKSDDPGAGNRVAVRLYEMVNDIPVAIRTFYITPANFATYFSLADMFGLTILSDYNVEITVRQEVAGGPTVITGQYTYRSS